MSRTGDWQPMESAPRNGERILVTIRASEQGPASVDTAFWGSATRHHEAGWRSGDSFGERVIAYEEGELSAWMALPSPDRSSWPEPLHDTENQGSGI